MHLILHIFKPSDDILSKMDKVMILGGGRVIFDGEFQCEEGKPAKSAADTIHHIISRGTVSGVRPSSLESFNVVQKMQSAITDSSDSNSEPKSNGEPKCGLIRLWQVKPLLGRLHLEFPPNMQDILVLPFCYLVISLWGSFDSGNPVQGKTFQVSLEILALALTLDNMAVLVLLMRIFLILRIFGHGHPYLPSIHFVPNPFDHELGRTKLPHLGFGGQTHQPLGIPHILLGSNDLCPHLVDNRILRNCLWNIWLVVRKLLGCCPLFDHAYNYRTPVWQNAVCCTRDLSGGRGLVLCLHISWHGCLWILCKSCKDPLLPSLDNVLESYVLGCLGGRADPA